MLDKKNVSLLLVDDNRDALNWGCRSTSIALCNLLSEKYVINDVINKRTVDECLPHAILPFFNYFFTKFSYKKYARALASLVIKKNKLLSVLLGLRGFVMMIMLIKCC